MLQEVAYLFYSIRQGLIHCLRKGREEPSQQRVLALEVPRIEAHKNDAGILRQCLSHHFKDRRFPVAPRTIEANDNAGRVNAKG